MTESGTSTAASHGPISLIIPVYNEVELLQDLHKEITAALDSAGMAPIKRGDSSRTPAAQRRGQVSSREVKEIKDVGAKSHFSASRSRGRRLTPRSREMTGPAGIEFEVILVNDGSTDGSTRLLDDYDLICGWRKEREDGWLLRKLPSRAANWLIRSTTGVHLHDYGCTLKVYRREYVEDIPLYGHGG